MKFSVIMPSYLKDYANSAQFKDQKLIRSIQSVLDQSFTDFELIIIADGCELTKQIVTTYFTDGRIKLLECKHKIIFDNTPRNTGIDNATGEYIIYLDIDDYWGVSHLDIINKHIKDLDWVFYNDLIFNIGWIERACNIRKLGMCGTSNVCHARKLNLRWGRPGYSHDYYFIQQLMTFKYHKKIETPEYYVMHIPGSYDL
jgi:glycosyltransferase involved in cell wall biosynthesis